MAKMLISDTKELLRQIALVDNRKVMPETIEAWHNIIGGIPFEIATQALKMAQQDSTIRYLEPRNIISWSKEAAFRLDRDKPKLETPVNSSPQPRCREHNELILSCGPCCRLLKDYEQDNGQAGIDRFAKAEIYG
jgi:hypothetical protein